MINADWRDFQSIPAMDETGEQSIEIDEYIWRMKKSGWNVSHIIQAPMPSERFQANVVAAMQQKKILGVMSRYVVAAKKRTCSVPRTPQAGHASGPAAYTWPVRQTG